MGSVALLCGIFGQTRYHSAFLSGTVMHFLAYYLHALDPFVFQAGFLRPRWYGIAYLLGFLFAYLLISRLSREGMLRLNPERVPDLVLNACIFGVLIGGRLGFVLFYDLPISLDRHVTPLLWDFSGNFPYWGALRVWDGGMSAHGGVLFTIVAILWFARTYKSQGANVINIGDASCMVVPIGLFFGRCANFINGELYGHVSNVPWAVKFPSEIWSPTNDVTTISDDQLFPVQQAATEYLKTHAGDLTASQVNFMLAHGHAQMRDWVLGLVGPGLDNPDKLPQVQQAIAKYMAPAPEVLSRADLATLWGGPHNGLWHVLYTQFNSILPARHPSQLYEALLEGLLLFIICWTIGRLWRKDGMASGAFLTFYPVMRILGEQFRVGDTPKHILGLEISKGILYSLPMFLAGAIYWIYWMRRDRRIPWKPPERSALPPAASPQPSPNA